MTRAVKMAFEPGIVSIHVSELLPVRQLPQRVQQSRKYQQVMRSVRAIGIVEPPIVARVVGVDSRYLLLDGHLRIEVLKELRVEEVDCLVSTDDEAFTYNRQINGIATLQEHRMIERAIERGVSEERIAEALDIHVSSVRQKRRLLDGICPEVAELLKDKPCPLNSFENLKKMKASRQIEVAELMVTMNNFTVSYSRALLAATPREHLVNPDNPKTVGGVSQEQIDRMEKEMASLQREVMVAEESYGTDMLNLVLARGYLTNLIRNERVSRYLLDRHPAIHLEFQMIVEDNATGAEDIP